MRRKRKEPHIRLDVEIPESLAAEVELLLFDPVRGKTRYGARQRLIENLLRKWVEESKPTQPSNEEQLP